MNLSEFASLLNYIRKHHNPFTGTHKTLKYVDPHIDLRTDTVFGITFRGMAGGEKVFHCQNECRELPECLYDRCMNWLASREW